MVWDVAKKGVFTSLSRYDKAISVLKGYFSDEDLKFIFFENVMMDKQKSINNIYIYDFLRIQPVPLVEEKSEKKINSSREIVFPEGVDESLMQELSVVYPYVKSVVGNVPNAWRL